MTEVVNPDHIERNAFVGQLEPGERRILMTCLGIDRDEVRDILKMSAMHAGSRIVCFGLADLPAPECVDVPIGFAIIIKEQF